MLKKYVIIVDMIIEIRMHICIYVNNTNIGQKCEPFRHSKITVQFNTDNSHKRTLIIKIPCSNSMRLQKRIEEMIILYS